MVGVARIELATPAMSMQCRTPDFGLLFNGLTAMGGALAQYLPKSPIGRGSFDSDSHVGRMRSTADRASTILRTAGELRRSEHGCASLVIELAYAVRFVIDFAQHCPNVSLPEPS